MRFYSANDDKFIEEVLPDCMFKSKAVNDRLLEQIRHALKSDYHFYIEGLIKNYYELMKQLICSHNLLIEAFQRRCVKCFELMVRKVRFESKEKQLKAVERLAKDALSITELTANLKGKPMSLLDMLAHFNTSKDLDSSLLELYSYQLPYQSHITLYRAYCRETGIEPMDRLVVTQSKIELALLCELIAS